MPHPVPNQVVNATAGVSIVDSVSATWTKPEGTITGYDITCSSGSASPSNGNDTLTGASCTNLPTAGEEYNMTITSISSDQRNDHIIALRACKKCFKHSFSFVLRPSRLLYIEGNIWSLFISLSTVFLFVICSFCLSMGLPVCASQICFFPSIFP